jgi:hypothetical protein
MGRVSLSRIAQLDQRTAPRGPCPLPAEAEMGRPRRRSGYDPLRTIADVRLCQSRRLTAVGIPSLNYEGNSIPRNAIAHGANAAATWKVSQVSFSSSVIVKQQLVGISAWAGPSLVRLHYPPETKRNWGICRPMQPTARTRLPTC